MSDASPRPAVSVILPTYNRAGFLPGAFASIAAQSFTDWHIIVVDDGSTDETPEVVSQFARDMPERVTYIGQKNAGAYAARNRGVEAASERYLAFFDSDDVWLPHHLGACVDALEQHPDLDWVYGACTLVNHATGAVLEESSFRIAGRARPFLQLQTRRVGDLFVIEDPGAIECQLTHGLFCGLQNSVLRARLFDGARFDSRSKVMDDQMFVIRALAAGARLAYFDRPHVVYRVHEGNSSAAPSATSATRQLAIAREAAAGFEALLDTVPLTRRQRRACVRRLAREYFWSIGYLGLWQAGHRAEALASFRRGLALWPWEPAAWKTYIGARLRTAGLAPRRSSART